MPGKLKHIPTSGYVNDEEMIDILSKAKGVFFPFDYEALGLIPLEALAVGTPVITYGKQGPYSFLKHLDGKGVYFVNSYPELKGKCLELLDSKVDPLSSLECRRYVEMYSNDANAMRFRSAIEMEIKRKNEIIVEKIDTTV